MGSEKALPERLRSKILQLVCPGRQQVVQEGLGLPPDSGREAYTQEILAHLVCFNT